MSDETSNEKSGELPSDDPRLDPRFADLVFDEGEHTNASRKGEVSDGRCNSGW